MMVYPTVFTRISLHQHRSILCTALVLMLLTAARTAHAPPRRRDKDAMFYGYVTQRWRYNDVHNNIHGLKTEDT